MPDLELGVVASAILMLFVVLDAPGNAPLFYYFTQGMSKEHRARVIRSSIVVATCILVAFALVGDCILEYFKITLDDFRIAGGIILFIYSVLGILGKTAAEEVSGEEIAVVPLATPLLAGPGAITVVVYEKYSMGLWIALLSIVVNICIAWAMLEYGEKLLRILGRRGSLVLSKLLAILLAAYAVAMIREGILAFARHLR